jgi:prolycopene isomerase
MQAFVDIECYLWSTVLAESTPMISTGMVLCDRHYGGINYPVGGVGEIPRLLVEGLQVPPPPGDSGLLFWGC